MTLSLAKKAGTAAAAAAALAGVSLGASASAATSASPAHPAGAPAQVATQPVASAHKAPQVVTKMIGRGHVDGRRWSVALEYYPTLPQGYTLLAKAPQGTGGSLLCQRMVIGGVRVDHQGGPWADCQPVAGAHDSSRAGETGLWGLHDKGTRGTRLMVANPEANVASGVVTLSDGTQLKARTVTVPGTDYRAWAVAIPNGKTIATVDQYDAHHHRVSHDTYWR